MTEEPIHIISLGAGVQSSTMALMADVGEILPRPVECVFGDTQDEPQSVYKWLNWLESELTIPVTRVTEGQLSVRAIEIKRSKKGILYSKTDIPFFTLNPDGSQGKITSRACTYDFKIKPLIHQAKRLVGSERQKEWRKKHRKALRLLSDFKRAPKNNKPPYPHEAWRECQSDPLAVQWIGISIDEITRMKPSRDPWILCRWPLIEKRMTRQDCLRWMAKHGMPTPPRSACVFCPFHNREEWLRLKNEEPVEFERAVQFEKRVQAAKSASGNFGSIPFLHRSCKPLSEVDFTHSDEKNGVVNFFENECEGMCGV